VVYDLRETEISNLNKAVAFSAAHNKDIRRLQITVENSQFVRGLDTIGNLPKQPDGTLDRKSSLAAKQSVKCLALDVLHHKVKHALGHFAKVGDAYSVRMLDRSRRLCFSLKAGDRLAFLQIIAA
jgi:hypothetical protein